MSNNEARAAALDSVITELTVLAGRLTPFWRNNVDRCIDVLRQQRDQPADTPITLLTYDAEAGMAYLYARTPPASGVAVAKSIPLSAVADAPFTAMKDYDADHVLLGIEFAAPSARAALLRAAVLNVEHC